METNLPFFLTSLPCEPVNTKNPTTVYNFISDGVVTSRVVIRVRVAVLISDAQGAAALVTPILRIYD